MSNKLSLSLASAAVLGMLMVCMTEVTNEVTEDIPPDPEAVELLEQMEADAQPEEADQPAKAAEHACKGMNECKGQGGCGVEGANSCHGANDCKGKGGGCTLSNKDDCPKADAGDADKPEEKSGEG